MTNLRSLGRMAVLLVAQSFAGCGAAAPPESATKPAVVASPSDGMLRPRSLVGNPALRVLPTNLFVAAFSADGEALLVGTATGHLRAFDARSGLPRATLRGHDTLLTALCVGEDGTTLSGDENGDILLWGKLAGGSAALQKAKPTLLPAEHWRAVTSLAVSPDGNTLVSVDRDGNALIWDLAARRVRHRLPAEQGPGNTLLSSGFDQRWVLGPHGKAASWTDKRVTLWSLDGDKPTGTLASGELPARVEEVRFRGDGSLEFIQPARKLGASIPQGARVVLSRAGDRAAIVSLDGLDIVEVATGRAVLSPRVPSPKSSGAANASQAMDAYARHWIAHVTPDGVVVQNDSQRKRVTLPELNGPATRVAFDAKEELLVVSRVGLEEVWAVADLDKAATAYEEPAPVEVRGPRDDGAPQVDRYGDPLPPHAIARIGTKRGHLRLGVAALSFAGPDTLLVVEQWGASYRWDVVAGSAIDQLPAGAARPAPAEGPHLAPNGKLVAACRDHGPLVIEEVASKRALPEVKSLRNDCRALAWSHDGRSLFAATNALRQIAIPSGRELRAFEVPEDARENLAGIALAPDGRLLAAGLRGDPRILLFDARTGKLARTLAATGSTDVVAFSADGKRLALSGADGTVRVVDVATGGELHARPMHNEGITAIVPLPDGESIVVSDAAGLLRRWSIAKGTPLADARRSGAQLARAALSDRGILASFERKYLAPEISTPNSYTSERWRTEARVELLDPMTLEVRTSVTTDGSLLAVRRDGKRALVLLEDGEVGVLDLDKPSPLGALDPRAGAADSHQDAMFSPDGRVFVIRDARRRVRFFDARTHALLGTCRADAPLAFSPDGKRLFFRARQGTVAFDGPDCNRSWQTALFGRLLAVSPDGKILAGADADSLRFHDAGTGALVGRIPIKGINIERMAFSADHKRLFTDGERFTVLVWDTSFLP